MDDAQPLKISRRSRCVWVDGRIKIIEREKRERGLVDPPWEDALASVATDYSARR